MFTSAAWLIPVSPVTNELELNLLNMKPFPHEYDVHLTGGPSGYASLSTPIRLEPQITES